MQTFSDRISFSPTAIISRRLGDIKRECYLGPKEIFTRPEDDIAFLIQDKILVKIDDLYKLSDKAIKEVEDLHREDASGILNNIIEVGYEYTLLQFLNKRGS